MLTLSLIVDMGVFSSFSGLGCTGHGARLTLRLLGGRLATFGFLWGLRGRGGLRSPVGAALSKTLHLFCGAGLGRGQSITCFIFAYSTHEKKKPKIGMTDMPTPTAARIMRLSRMWFVNCRIQPCEGKRLLNKLYLIHTIFFILYY